MKTQVFLHLAELGVIEWFGGGYMRKNGLRIAVGILALCFVALPRAQAQDKVKVKGLITARTGDTMVLKTTEGTTVTVVLDDGAKVQQPKGLMGLGFRKKKMSAAMLIPGLKVSVDGTSQDSTHVLAKSITFDKDDLQTAEMIQAGLNPTEKRVTASEQNIAANTQDIKTNQQNTATNTQNIAANQQNIASNKTAIDANAAETSKRFSDLTEYDTQGQLDVHFASGRAAISEEDKAALKKLAQDAGGIKGYIIQVKGFADSSGSAAMNQKLSMERAQNVIAYLIQDCNVPVHHVIAPGAMGEAVPVGSNETKSGRAENRRVEVRILVNKGIAGS